MIRSRYRKASALDAGMRPPFPKRREIRNATLDLTRIAYVNRDDLNSERRGYGPHGAELSGLRRIGRISHDGHPRQVWCDIVELFKPFSAHCVFEEHEPVALPPSRTRLSTKPAPTGSPASGNTMGMVLVACCNGGTVKSPVARMTSGASAPAPARACEAPRHWLWPSAARCAHCGRWSSPRSQAPDKTQRGALGIRDLPRSGTAGISIVFICWRWARVESGHAAAEPAIIGMKSRRRTQLPPGPTMPFTVEQ